jgi:uncharacterized protein involved in outer membrane biogenesis
MRLRTIVLGTVVVVVAVISTAVAVVLNTDFSQYRGLVQEKVKEATGRDLAIRGDVKVVVGLKPSLAVNDVSFANASWGSRPQMIIAKRFEIEIDLLPLLFGNIRVRRLLLLDTDMLLETDPRGRGNWQFETSSTPPAAGTSSGTMRLPEIHEVHLEGVLFVFHDGETRTTKRFSLGFATLKGENENSPLKVDANGTYNDFYFELDGYTGPATAITRVGAPFPIDLLAKLGATKTELLVKGQFADVSAGKGYDLQVTATTDEIAQFSNFARDAHVADLPLPPLGPLKAEMRLTDGAPGGKPSIPSLKLEAGKPDLALAKANGSVRQPFDLKGVTLDGSLEGSEIAALSGLVFPGLPQGVPQLPALGPYKLAVKAASGAGDLISLSAVRFDLGRDDLLKLEIDGAIREPLARRGFALNIAADARDLTVVAQQLQLASPISGPLSLRGKIADAGSDRYALSGFKLEAAGSDLGGEATLSVAAARPVVTANLVSALIDLGRLMPKASAAGGQPGPTAPAPAKSDGRLFSADPLPLDLLNTADADFRYRADAIRTSQGAVIHDLSLQASLQSGALAVRPFTAVFGGGAVSGEMTLADRTGDMVLKLSAKAVELGAVDKEIPGEDLVSGGKSDAEIDLKGGGTSVRELMASLNGSIVLGVGPGTFKSRYTDMLGLGGLTDFIGQSLPRQETTQLNCLVTRFNVQDGVATGRPIVVDTARLTLFGRGTINLKNEQLDVRLNTHTKVTSLLSLLPPVQAGGTLAAPSFSPDVAGGAVDAVGDLLGDVISLPGRIFGGGQQERDICVGALTRAGGAAAPQAAPQQQQQRPAQPSTNDPARDLGQGIERNLRNLFGR